MTRIAAIETMRADAGWRMFSFCKVTSDDGLVGWSEYNEGFGSRGLSSVIEALAPLLLGHDALAWEARTAQLHVATRQSRGGLNQQAIAALENALLDLAAKARGIPVYRLFGGPVRPRIPLYWSHFATYRVGTRAPLTGRIALATREDLAHHAAEVKEAGFRALKTNILPTRDGLLGSFSPGFGATPGAPELNWDNTLLRQLHEHLATIRDAVGPDMGLMLDVNFHFKTEGFRRVADAVAPFNLTWLEIDTHDAEAMAFLRGTARCPLSGGETLHQRRELRPYLEKSAFDTAIIDVVWNGLGESLKMAAMADAYEVNVAPHNFYGHLSSMISAHFSAVVPNFRIMEIDIDSVAWRDEFYTTLPEIVDGELVLSEAPGWGMDVNEHAVRARPPRG
jgi:L-alanine-DL-glutamate epimerase-like enolase superfamily enzyme